MCLKNLLILSILIMNCTNALFEVRASILKPDHIIYNSNANITKITVVTNGDTFTKTNLSDIPRIFFTVSDNKYKSGSCIFVLEHYTAIIILEGGRDIASAYGSNKTYFGASSGLFVYQAETQSANKYGILDDDILQLQIANGTEKIYIRTSTNNIFIVENEGHTKTPISNIECALTFVIDNVHNIYYIACDDEALHILSAMGNKIDLISNELSQYKDLKLLRPPYILSSSIPVIGDGFFYMVFSNGELELEDLYIHEKPIAYSVDDPLYLVLVVNGDIYEYNLKGMMHSSLFSNRKIWPYDVTRILIKIIDKAKASIVKKYLN